MWHVTEGMRRRLVRLAACVAVAAVLMDGGLAAQGPDATQMSGLPLPAPELATGTLSVRVVRETMGNNLPGQTVSVTVGGQTRTGVTNDQGRAEFADLPVGQTVVATTTVGDELIVSEELQLPARGGLRVALVAGAAAARARRQAEAQEAASRPATAGQVEFGGQTRVVMEWQNDVLTVFYLLEIVNATAGPVDPGTPIDIVLPRGASSPTLMEGSTTQATLRGEMVRVTGPYVPGTTNLQIGFSLPDHTPTMQWSQVWPIRYPQPFVAVEQVGTVTLVSPQLPRSETIDAEGGRRFILASGAAIAAGTPLTVTLEGLPAHSVVPRSIAVGVAVVLILGFGVYASRGASAPAREALEQERARLLRDLVEIEQRRRAGQPRAKDAEREPRLVAELERVMASLDAAPGGGQGAAA